MSNCIFLWWGEEDGAGDREGESNAEFGHLEPGASPFIKR